MRSIHFEKRPFIVPEHALLAYWRRPSWSLTRPFFIRACKCLILWTLWDQFLQRLLSWIRLVGCFISHRVSQMNRRLSAYVLVRGVFYFSQSSQMNRSHSTNVFSRSVFYLSQSFTEGQKPFCIRLGSWCILSLTEFHRGTEAFLRTGRTHKRLQADDRYHRTLLLTWVERFCEFCMPEAFCEIETVRKKGLSNLWDLWEKYLPSESRNCSFSHRGTQMNRTHSIPQRH